MKVIDMVYHDFGKQNLVTTPKGDFYKCASCGASGYRMGLAPSIEVSNKEYKKSLKCPLLKQVKTTNPKIITTQLFTVVKTPWVKALPDGTIIKEVEPRPGHRPKKWFQRVDGKLLFPPNEGGEPADADGKFSLFDEEYEPIN